ncbi:hypothetical protein [Sphingobacterium sp. CZ-UAM]|uniref:hypothetical protein n=1 Tax=Sphingobacterium sp. CZ-UAM TaxID=1933868 RepID=UPI00111579E8|nr:hypothetical protein [Sphingobacterium sp. CZ-UAM]
MNWKNFALLVLASFLCASCSEKPKIQFVDKDGHIHLLTREGERTAMGLQKIIAHGIDTIVTIDETGGQKIWTASDVDSIDTTKIQYYLKRRNGDNINIYTPLEGTEDLRIDRGRDSI